ncbi:MAG: hypothetical protein KKA84_09030 [Bacteroidetes bacterium]|nr:hypothetical protein [Bacteroidota bacterium]
MLAKKKKLSKKDIKEDKLVTSFFQVQQFIEEHQKKLLIGVAAVVVIFVIAVIYTNKVEQDNLAATTQLSRIMDVYNSGSYQEAIDGRPGTNLVGLKSIVEEYGSSEQGQNAKIMLANAHYYLGDIEVAKEYFGSYSGKNPLFKGSALAGLAACKEAVGEFEDAADLYMDAANITTENPMNADYLLKAGLNLNKVNKFEEAKELFESIQEEYANSLAAGTAKKYLTASSN